MSLFTFVPACHFAAAASIDIAPVAFIEAFSFALSTEHKVKVAFSEMATSINPSSSILHHYCKDHPRDLNFDPPTSSTASYQVRSNPCHRRNSHSNSCRRNLSRNQTLLYSGVGRWRRRRGLQHIIIKP